MHEVYLGDFWKSWEIINPGSTVLVKNIYLPSNAGWAPGRTRHPATFKCLAANAADMVLLHTDCFHIKSAFLMKSLELADPPAHPPR